MEATLIYPERNLWAAARDGLIWLSGPVSERGAARASRMALHMGGRMVHERRLAMREHPVGRRLLEERPELCATLNDMRGLAAMPEGRPDMPDIPIFVFECTMRGRNQIRCLGSGLSTLEPIALHAVLVRSSRADPAPDLCSPAP